jgi:hypothetical protein
MQGSIIALLTDFGHTDPFVGVVKGVLRALAPKVCLVDLTHEVPAGNVTTAAYLLQSSVDYFPTGTVFLVVVDPGVGSRRKPVALESEGRWFVGPDNGLFPAALEGRKISRTFELRNSANRLARVSSTFHGRDVFAPAAAHLAKGGRPSALGPAVKRLILGSIPKPVRKGKIWQGEVLWVDHFGNLITNLTAAHMGKTLRVGKKTIHGLSSHYAQVAKGQPLALVGSSGQIEISVNGGRADGFFKAEVGTKVWTVSLRETML